MNEEIDLILGESEESMNKAIARLEQALLKIRAGKADPALLNDIFVDYYGTNTPLNQVANINTPDAKTIAIQPWEKPMIDPIEKAILAANIGLTPVNNGELIRISLPPLTEERRKELFKQVKSEGEAAKVSIRNARKDANDMIKGLKKDGLSEDMAKDAEDSAQQLTDKSVKLVDEIVAKKEKDVMTV